MNEDILTLLLQVENEYQTAMRNAVKEMEEYADECRQKQLAYIEELKHGWNMFEKTENEKLAKMLSDDEERLETMTIELKNQLKLAQEKIAEMISERLKKEVLSSYGNS
ncbi:MAG: hypothetical protein FWF15_06450 [Oscillospiraceae bacterium]|nr:hypothetical protein [Oscillospiraceae bacterium]